MPELPEVEAYRRLAEERALGRAIAAVDAPDAWYLKGGLDATAVTEALLGRRLDAARRIGKLLLLDTSDGGPVAGLRFGMTGRLLVDDQDAVGELLYTSKADRPEWDRFSLRFADGGRLRISVQDQGHQPGGPRLSLTAEGEHGRGLLLVDSMSSAWGSHDAGGHSGRIVWAELPYGPEPAC